MAIELFNFHEKNDKYVAMSQVMDGKCKNIGILIE